jgi:hypothetical protein
LTIAGTPLAPILAAFEGELAQAGIRRLRPHFYLSTEWGVPFRTISIAIPFYLAQPHLTAFHAKHAGYVEGAGRADILRYLRHEMGHVVNYAYQLYEHQEWVKHFGSITQPYLEEYRPEPFSQRYVSHLPGWYAQKHPDEDWAETFAVWLTPGRNWPADYIDRPEALSKLEYCAQTMTSLRDVDPAVTTRESDEDIGDLTCSLAQFYGRPAPAALVDIPRGLDGAMRAIFEEGAADATVYRRASELIRRLEPELMANVYRWTGHLPERSQLLLRQLAVRADQLSLVFPEVEETRTGLALTVLVTALAMNYVYRGTYVP